jgi:hypothetical protein
MTTKFGDFATAADARDVIKDIAAGVVNELRPAPAYAVVTNWDLPNQKAQIYFVNDSSKTQVWVPMPGLQPTQIGQFVRIEGTPGDRYLAAVLGQSRVADVVTVPSPANVSATTATDYTLPHVIVSWSHPDATSILSYQITYVPVNAPSTQPEVRYVQSPTQTIRLYPLAKDTQYRITVAAVSFTGAISPAVTVLVTTGHDTTAPATPTGVAMTAGYQQVEVTWADNTEPDTGNGIGTYRVQLSTSAGFSPINRDVIVSATKVTINALADSTAYWARVYARDADGNQSIASSSVTASTYAGILHTDKIAPASSPTPTIAGGPGWLLAQWTPIVNADPVIYEVHVSVTSGFTPGAGTKIGETSLNEHFIKNLPGGGALVYGTTYYVKLIAKDFDGSAVAGAQGSGVMVKVGTADVTTITGAQVHDGSAPASSPVANVVAGMGFLYVYWAAIANNDTVTYEVHLSTTTGFTPSGATKVTEVTDLFSFVNTLPGTSTKLTYGTTYFIKLVAKDLDGSAAAGTQGSGAPLQVLNADVATLQGSKLKDGSAPASSPTPTVVGGVGYLYVNWLATANNDPVIYEVHLSTTSGFATSGATKVTELTGLFTFIRTLPGTSTPLSYATTYYIKIIAKDLDGSAAASAQGSATLTQATTADLAVNSITAASGIIADAAIGNAKIVNLDAAKLDTGFLNAARVAAGSIDATKLLVTIGGQNYVKNSGFTASGGVLSGSVWVPDYWSVGSGGVHDPLGWQTDTTDYVSGPNSFKVYYPANFLDVWALQDITLPAGRYVISYWVKRTSVVVGTGRGSGLNIDGINGASLAYVRNWGVATNGVEAWDLIYTGTNAWRQEWTVVDILQGTAPLGSPLIRLYLHQGHSGTAQGITQFDNISVTQGDIPVPWMPTADEILPGTIIGNMIQAGSIAAVNAVFAMGAIQDADIGNLNAAKINAGFLSAARIQAATLTADKLVVTPGGGNKVRNGNFATASSLSTDPDGSPTNTPFDFWWQYNWSPTGTDPNATYTVNTSHTYFGTNACRIQWTTNTGNKGLRQYVPVGDNNNNNWQANTTYMISMWVYHLGASVGPPWFNFDAGGSTDIWILNPTAVQGVWQRYVFKKVMGAVTTGTHLYPAFTHANGDVLIGAVQVEQGDLATEYAPRPDEILPGTIVANMIAANTITAGSAIIGAAAIGSGQIADLSASKITTGTLTAQTVTIGTSGTIKSANYVAGSAGWALWTDGSGNGQLEVSIGTFRNVTIQGTLAANTITGWLTASSGGGFRTASSGQRIEMSNANVNNVLFYTGDSIEIFPGYLRARAPGNHQLILELQTAVRSDAQTSAPLITLKTGSDVTSATQGEIWLDKANIVNILPIGSGARTNVGGSIYDDSNHLIRDAGGGWVRTYGQTGWFNNDYGGGLYMTDTTWVRVYNNKAFIAYGDIWCGDTSSYGSTIRGHRQNQTNWDTHSFLAYNPVNTIAGYGAWANGTAVHQHLDTNDITGFLCANSNNTAYAPYKASAFVVGSSIKIKNNVRTLQTEQHTPKIKQLNPVRFKKGPVSLDGDNLKRSPLAPFNEDGDFLGLIAEEVVNVYPEVVYYSLVDGKAVPSGIDYSALVAPLISTIHELTARIELLESRGVKI